MNKASLVGVWPSASGGTRPDRDDFSDMEEFADAIEDYGNDIIDRVLDTMGRDVTAIVANHTLGGMSDEAFKLLMDYLSKYDAMLRDEI